MNFKTNLYGILLLLLVLQLTSCEWAARRTISLDLDYENSASKTITGEVAPDDIEKAVGIIDEIMSRYGLRESNLSTAQKESGALREYFKLLQRNAPSLSCTIYRREEKGRTILEVDISEYFAVKLSITARDIISDIQDRFAKAFGARRITIK